jgi:hypothetical protein
VNATEILRYALNDNGVKDISLHSMITS